MEYEIPKNVQFTEHTLPKKEDIFTAFKLCPFEKTKVVIVGQDPYHGDDQAHGLSFSIQCESKPTPPSLRNIFKELKEDTNTVRTNKNLSDWAEQGILLLNAILTVEKGKPGSHKKKGWEEFTDAIIKRINDEKTNVVFILWGKYAQNKCKLVDETKHCVLKANHPSPMSANRGGFFGCKHFSKCNEYLERHNENIILW